MSGYRLVMLPPQDELTRRWAEQISEGLPEVSVVVAESDAEAIAALADAEAAYGTLSRAQLEAARRLSWLQAPAAAPPAGFFFDALVAHPVVVTNFRGIYNDHVATHAVAMVLALARGFPRYVLEQARGRWDPIRTAEGVVHLPEATVLVVGLGGIGSEIARMMKTFGSRVIATDARVTDGSPVVDEVAPPAELDRLIPEADFVVLTVPHTPETEGMFNARRLSMMKSTAHLVNIGRGMTVRLDDLVSALERGEIAGAGLDVFEEEPLPTEHPLWAMSNVLLTPHVAVAGPYVDERRFAVLADNASRFGAGEPLLNVVDKAAWF
ncbi:MAG TPA: D-2-hydroxyacid dehydrogenase [Acidimicrobiia bacterium]|nr:D-2-hydroxyacid dehydrogenase [Acidimicrobiia bacterium]